MEDSLLFSPTVESSALRYFDKNIADEETVLTSSDFELGSQLSEQLVDEDWNNEAVYQNDLFEGDIAMDLNVTTIQLFINGALSNQHFHYNAVRNRHQLWPRAIIPYAISTQYSTYSRSVIAASMQEYGTHTCIQWVPKNDNHISYVYIMPDRGCYSMVGRTGDILVLVSQFEKYGHGTIQSLDMEYDYASIMHYGSRAFSRNGLPTVVPKDTAATIGQRTGFSKIDAAKINKLYNCPQGWCKRNAKWMQDYCPESCEMCGTRPEERGGVGWEKQDEPDDEIKWVIW
uniref:Peptidase M12A domain-containing protein n=1 Tax=Parascaris univalens TaxID=6257 RepID=A0A915AY96_PARUN